MRTLVLKLVVVLGSAVVMSGCAGSCVSSGGIVDVCKPGWTASECAEWDEERVNGASWTLRGGTCESLGYSVECCDGSYGQSRRDCC